MTIQELTAKITAGEYDEFIRALDARRFVMGMSTNFQAVLTPPNSITTAGGTVTITPTPWPHPPTVGNTVVFNTLTSPQYLHGWPAKIVKVNRAKVVVIIDKGVGRFRAGQKIRVSPKFLNLV